jgi:regulator of protease activity HflC (stomatin/prohibitin superfamily)
MENLVTSGWIGGPLRVRKHERALLLKDTEFVRILEPGEYRFFNPTQIFQAQIFDIANEPAFESPYLNYLLKQEPELVARYFVVADLSDDQVGLVYVDNKLKDILPPGVRKAYWKGIRSVRVETVNIAETPELPAALAESLMSMAQATQSVYFHKVYPYETVLLYTNGQLHKQLHQGLNAFWKYNRTLDVKTYDLRLQSMDVSGQEILTQDKVTLRLNLSADFQIADPLKAAHALSDYKDFLYKELQFALRAAVGTRPLDKLLEEKEALSQVILAEVRPKVVDYGLHLETVGIKDIILPGEMRELMNQVMEAEKQAQANLIRRREETAATRSLLNTAKVMEDNPTLLRLKELETLEKITPKIQHLSVYGGFDGMLKDLVKLKANE